MIDRLGRLPQPVIAAVHGVCFTGGLELALACDFILADATARFADTHGKWGLVGAWGMSQRLPRRIGVPAAKRMMMTGRSRRARRRPRRIGPGRSAGAGRAGWTLLVAAIRRRDPRQQLAHQLRRPSG